RSGDRRLRAGEIALVLAPGGGAERRPGIERIAGGELLEARRLAGLGEAAERDPVAGEVLEGSPGGLAGGGRIAGKERRIGRGAIGRAAPPAEAGDQRRGREGGRDRSPRATGLGLHAEARAGGETRRRPEQERGEG